VWPSSPRRAAGKAHEEIVDSGNRRRARAKYLRTGAHVNYSRDSIRLSLVFDYRCDLRLCLVKGRARAANRARLASSGGVRGIATFFKISYNTVQRILSISRRTLTENIKHAKNKQKLNKTKAIQRNTRSKWEKTGCIYATGHVGYGLCERSRGRGRAELVSTGAAICKLVSASDAFIGSFHWM
jgi:hypothetical protein